MGASPVNKDIAIYVNPDSFDFYQKVLNEQGFSNIQLADQDKVQPRVCIDTQKGKNLVFDLNYFLSHVDKNPMHLLSFIEDTSDDILWWEPHTLKIRNKKKDGSIYADGVEKSGVVYYPSGNFPVLVDEGILTPCRQQNKIYNFTNLSAALFLDRDGVLNEDIGYACKMDQINFNENIFPLLQWAQEEGFLLVVLTNQSAIARGKTTPSKLTELHLFMDGRFLDEGIKIRAWYCCPYLPDAEILEYKKESLLRKPSPGMAILAAQDYNIDLNLSFMLGDKKSDHLHLPGIHNIHIKRQYDLNNSPSPIFEKEQDILVYLQKKLGQIT
ncbi:MAG: HAD-IIIA family hydrolase [Pseudomonadota bacterium]